MKRAILLAATMAVAIAGCSTPKLEIREIANPHRDRSDGTTDGRVALGLSQLAMGNVGLALESFRRAARDDPQSYRALQGLAECYLQIGKPALASRYLQQALALRPDVPELYRALAAAADGQGKKEEAVELREEAALRTRNPLVPIVAAQPPVADAIKPKRSEAGAVTIDLTLKPLRDDGPRLVRLSLGEVALMTGPGSPFAGERHAADSTIHPPLRILNAARVQGIAARTRGLLASRGVEGAEIGDAPERKSRSELRHAKGDAARARALAARLPFGVTLVERDGPLVLLVGRNAAS